MQAQAKELSGHTGRSTRCSPVPSQLNFPNWLRPELRLHRWSSHPFTSRSGVHKRSWSREDGVGVRLSPTAERLGAEVS